MTGNSAYRLGMMLLSLLLLACVHQETDHGEVDVELVFEPVVSALTKADAPVGAYPEGESFGVDLWSYPAGTEQWTSFLSDEKISFDGEKWRPQEPLRWPSVTHRLAVQAWAPYGHSVVRSISEGIGFDGVDLEREQTDLLYTEQFRDLSKAPGAVVSLPFRHALCYVDFAMRTNAMESETITIRRVSMAAIYTRGDFRSLPEPHWTALGERHEVEFFSGEVSLSAVNQPLGGGRWTLPQVVGSLIRVELDYTDSNGITLHETVETNLMDKLLEPGRQYTLTLSYLPREGQLLLDDSFLKEL